MFRLLNSRGWLLYIGDRGIGSIEDAAAYIHKILFTENFNYHVLLKKDTLEPIGILSLIQRENFEFPDFGFALLPEFQHQGYAKEASETYLKHLFSLQPLLKVIAICKEHNTPSIQLLRALGFEYSHSIESEGQRLQLYARH